MKIHAYMRVGRDPDNERIHIAANVRPNHRPLTNTKNQPLPTVAFGIALDIPDKLFNQAEQIIATLFIPENAAQIAAEVQQ